MDERPDEAAQTEKNIKQSLFSPYISKTNISNKFEFHPAEKNRKELCNYGYLEEDGLNYANILLKKQKNEMHCAGLAIDNLNNNFRQKIKGIMNKLENRLEKCSANWLKDDLQRKCDCFSTIKGEFNKLQILLSEQTFLASSRQAIIDELTSILNKERDASTIYNKAIKEAIEDALKTKLRLADWCFRKKTLMKYFGKLRVNAIQSRNQRQSQDKFKETKKRILQLFTQENLNERRIFNETEKNDIKSAISKELSSIRLEMNNELKKCDQKEFENEYSYPSGECINPYSNAVYKNPVQDKIDRVNSPMLLKNLKEKYLKSLEDIKSKNFDQTPKRTSMSLTIEPKAMNPYKYVPPIRKQNTQQNSRIPILKTAYFLKSCRK